MSDAKLQNLGLVRLEWQGKFAIADADEWIVKLNLSGPESSRAKEAEQLIESIAEDKIDLIRDLGGEGLFLISAPMGTAYKSLEGSLKAIPGFDYIEPNFLIWADSTVPNDPNFATLYGLHNTGQSGGTVDADIDAPEAWDITTGSSSVVVGVIDTGVDYNHPDLAANIWTNPGEIPGNAIDDDGNGFVDDIHGYDFVNNDGDPMDDHYHGTHVSGTIGGVSNNGIGVAGTAWNVKIMGIKFLSSGGSGTTANAISAVNYATMMKNSGVNIRLTSNSWGGGAYSAALETAINAAGTAGMLFVAAAGNDNTNNDSSPHYPSSYNAPNIIAVAATDRNDARASFSSYGLTSVDLAAPGVDTYSTSPGNTYRTLSGTSMATPHVAGVASLAFSISPSATYQAVRDAILAGTDPIPAMAGKSVTGGRLNALGTLQELGLQVIASTPSIGAAVSAPPTDFNIAFSQTYRSASINAADLLVNGTPADSVVQVDSTNVTFHFATSPVTSQGLQSMSIAANTILRDIDGSGNTAWNASFRYDLLPMAVVQATPAAGSLVSLPMTSLRIDFNEAYDPTSIGIDDLVLNAGTVTSVSQIDSDTVEYTLSGIHSEQPLNVTLGAGSVRDAFGNPMPAPFAASYDLDIGTVPLPAPFTPITPRGSLGYQTTATGTVSVGGDTDSFTMALDAGQTITVIVDPDSALRPTITLRNPSGTAIASATAVAVGKFAVIQPVAAPAAGIYSLEISGADGSGGTYSVRVVLNAAVEEELYDGPANDTRATAQNINSSFLDINDTAQRGAVLGRAELVAGLLPTETEPNNSTATANVAAANFANFSGNLYHMGLSGVAASSSDSDYFNIGQLQTGDVLTVTVSASGSGRGQVSDAYLYLYRGSAGSPIQLTSDDDSGPGLDSLIYRYTVTTTDTYYVLARPLSGSGAYQVGIYLENTGNAPATGGTVISETEPNDTAATANDVSASWRPVQHLSRTSGTITSGDSDYYQYQFNAGDLVTINIDSLSSLDARVALLNAAGTVIAYEDGSSSGPSPDSPLYAFRIPSTGTYFVQVLGSGTGSYNADIYLSTTIAPPAPANSGDFYSFSLDAGQSVTIVAASATSGAVDLILQDSSGTNLATGIGTGATKAISNFVVSSAGTYYAAVNRGLGNEYALIVTRDATFDLEENGAAATATPIGPGGVALGYVEQGSSGVEPDNYPAGSVLTNVVPGITLSVQGSSSSAVTSQTASPSSTGARVFANGATTYWNSDSYWLRADFAGGASTVSIDVVPDDSADPGIMRAYNASGTLLQEVTVPAAPVGSFTKITISRPSADIAYILASGLGGDTVNLDNLVVGGLGSGSDYYSIAVNPGDVLVINTLTPGDGANEFGNTLNPKVEVYSPSGVLVASDDNGAPDGRNAALTYAPSASGTYFVRVLSAGQTTGEYVLSVSNRPLTVTLPSDADENGGPLTGTLAVTPIPTSDLVVSLSSSDPSRLSVPAFLTIPAGETSVSLPLTILDNSLLDGLQGITITATANGYANGAGTITIHDDEAATLTVSLPATAGEGDSALVGTITSSAAPTRDIAVQLLSSAAGQATVPLTVTLPAGQMSATFHLAPVNDTQIDGNQLVTITASVESWTSGMTSIDIIDNDALLTVTLPASGWEGQALNGAGMVQIGGTLGTDLVIALLSSDLSELTLPATVTIPAGQTSTTFTLTLASDALKDGSQAVQVTASATGLSGGDDSINVLDADLDRLAFDPISGPKTAAVPFGVSARAYNISNDVIAVYSASAVLSATGLAGVLPINPTMANFAAGVWSGNVSLNAVDPTVTISIDIGGGMAALSNVFAVQAGPITHFDWSSIGNPQIAGVPFTATITARDANGFTADGFNGTASLSGSVGTLVSQTMMGNVAASNSSSGTYTMGYSFTPSSNLQVTHVRRYFGTKISIWTNNGTLLGSQAVSGTNGSWSETALSAPIQLQAGVTYRIGVYTAGSTYYWRTDMSGATPVGTINQGYYSSGDAFPGSADSSKWLFVDLRGNLGTYAPVSITPPTAAFVNGVWTGDVTVAQSAINMHLHVTDGASHLGDSNNFNVIQRTLTLSLPPDVRENDGAMTGILSVSPAPASDLVVTLTNSKPSRLTVPTTLTIPAGQTSVLVPITILNNGVLDGLETASITASAATYAAGIGEVRVHDNESAVVSVSLPASASEGASTLVGIISFSDPAMNDIVVQLSSSNTSRATVPTTVIVPAGQTSAEFDVTVVDNTVIDGLAFISVQANVEGWTGGYRSIIVSDNDNHLTITLPTGTRWEGQTLSGFGTVRIGGTMSQDLVVDLISSDTTELSVPVNVVMPAGQTTVTFSLSLLSDGLRDGMQTVTVTAAAAAAAGGITDGSANLVVHDADVDHISVDPISSPKTAAVPFGITARAWNLDNELIVIYAGSGALSVTGTGGAPLPLTPAASLAFTAGVGTANVAINAVDAAAMLRVSSAGISGTSGLFAVEPGPLASFQWGTIGSPQYVDQPFASTLTAKDANGFTVDSFNGTVNLSGSVGVGVGTVEILSFVTYADTSTAGEYRNTLRAISAYFTNYHETSTTVTTPAQLQAALVGKNVFLIPEQENVPSGTLAALGTSWATVLNNFVTAGGMVIACSHFTDEHLIFQNSGLMSVSAYATYSSQSVTKPADTVLNAGVSTPFSAPYVHNYLTTTNGTVSLRATSGAYPVVLSRDVGNGHVVLIGTDYYTLGTGMDRVVANAVQWAGGNATPVAITPAVSGNFVNGVWSGQITVLEPATNMYLRADDGAGHASNSSGFEVAPTSPATPILHSSTDTGVSGSDGITNRNNSAAGKSLQFTVGNTFAGATVTIYANGVPIGSAIASGSSTLVTTNGSTVLADGSVSITARQRIVSDSPESPAATITIDTQSPNATIAPDLQNASDSGRSNSDQITNINTPSFDIFAHSNYRVFSNGVQISSDYEMNPVFNAPIFSDGVYDITVVAVDAAGNVSGHSAARVVTIDTVAPSVPSAPDLQTASDSGGSEFDDITSITTPTFDLDALPHFRFFRDGVQLTSDYESGSTYTTTLQPDGTYDYTVVAVDLAGNASDPSAELEVTIDSTILKASQLAASSDSGVSSSDLVTFFDGSLARPLIFTVPGTAAGATVTIYANGIAIGSVYSPGGAIIVSSDGSNPLADGTYRITVRQQFPGQSESFDSDYLEIEIDTTAPTAVVPDLQAGSDTGVSDGDNITSDTTPTLDVATPYYSLYRNGVLISGQFASGAFTVNPLTDGTHLFSAVAMDAAGNWAFPGASLSVTIDTVAPTVASASFEYETQQRLVLTFDEAIASPSELDFENFLLPGLNPMNKSVSSTATAVTFAFGATLADGNYQLVPVAGKVTDLAGNILSAYSFNFFVLGGDANRDRKVDVHDLIVLANNWMSTGGTFSKGDFNYDGIVDARDLGILSQRWQQNLDALPPPLPAQPTSATRRPAVRTPTRVISLVE